LSTSSSVLAARVRKEPIRPAMQALAKGDPNTAVDIWQPEKRWSTKRHSKAQLALVYHVCALDWRITRSITRLKKTPEEDYKLLERRFQPLGDLAATNSCGSKFSREFVS